MRCTRPTWAEAPGTAARGRAPSLPLRPGQCAGILPLSDDERQVVWQGVSRETTQAPVRRSLLVAHVAVSVGWLGLTVGLLALGATAFFTGDAETARAATRAMKVFGDWLIVPIALLALLTGLVLSLGTPWDLARHRWVWTKFWLPLITAGLSVFALRPGHQRGRGRGNG